MKTLPLRQIGTSELYVSGVALGCWPIAGMTSLDVNERDSLATLAAALDHGINFFDTAYCYGAAGESEKLVGRALAKHRDQVVIASKGGIHWDSRLQQRQDATPATILRQCAESLQRLQTDCIDLYYLHGPDPRVPLSETATAFERLITEGKIRYAGVSNCTVPQIEEFVSVCPIVAVQPRYNLLQRGIESSLIPWCQQRTIGVIHYWPLMKGLLAGKIRRNHPFDPQDKRLRYPIFQGENFEKAQSLLDLLDQIAAEHQKTVSQVVVNWSLHRPGITTTLCGAKRDWQISETAGAMGWQLNETSLQRIQQKLDSLGPLDA